MLNSKQSKAIKLVLFLILGIAVFLRLLGIKHGFPFIFHPDEPTIIRSALGLRFNINPEHFDWPHLYIYLNYFLYMGVARFRTILVDVGLKETISAAFPLLWNDVLIYYYLTRIFSAVLGALTIFPVYLAGKEIFNKRVGLLAALTFAVLPFHVWHSHYALSDVPMVFMLACGLFFAAKIMKQNDVSHYAKAGLFIGLAASTKYNGGLSAVMVPLAHLLRVSADRDESLFDFWGIVNLVVSGLFAVFGFLLGTPFALLDFETFTRTDGPKGALWQFTNVGSIDLAARPAKFVSDVTYKITNDVGYVVFLVFGIVLIGLLIRSLRRINKQEDQGLWFLTLPALFLLAYISGFRVSRSHYFMISYPFLALVFGYALDKITQWFRGKGQFLGYLSLALLVGVPFYFSLEGSLRFAKGDTRNRLADWFSSNLAPTDKVIYTNNNLAPVLETMKINKDKGVSYIPQVARGYFVLSYSSDQELIDHKADLQPYISGLVRVFSVDSTDMLGPGIEVYRIN